MSSPTNPEVNRRGLVALSQSLKLIIHLQYKRFGLRLVRGLAAKRLNYVYILIK